MKRPPVAVAHFLILATIFAYATTRSGSTAQGRSAHARARIVADAAVNALPLPIVGKSPSPSPSPVPYTPPRPVPAWWHSLALVSYWPGATGPNPMAPNQVNIPQLNADLTRIASVHANAVRLIIGTVAPNQTTESKIETFIQVAWNHGLRTAMTLFDGYTTYDVSWSTWWVNTFMQPYSGDPRVAFVELQNEIDPGNPKAMSWAQSMIPVLRNASGGIPVTISEGGWCNIVPRLTALQYQLRNSPPDFWSVHFYCQAAAAYDTLSQAASMVAPIPVMVGESGYSTVSGDPSVTGSMQGGAWQEAAQADFFRVVDEAAAAAGLPPAAVWVDSDIEQQNCSNCPSFELHFGLWRVDGSAKPSVDAVSSAFQHAMQNPNLNLGFESDSSSYPTSWIAAASGYATFIHDSSRSHSGSWSAEIQNAGYDSRHNISPAWMLDVPVKLQSGRTYTASAWATGIGTAGPVVVAIIWIDESGNGLGYVVSPDLPYGDAGWTNLTVAGTPPSGAAYAQIALTSQSNPGTVWFDDVTFQ